MFKSDAASGPIEVGFYLGRHFSIVPFINAVDSLRMANRLSGENLFHWQLLSDDGKPVEAINGMTIVADRPIGEVGDIDNLICCVGFDPVMDVPEELKVWLRRLSSRGSHLGALGAGSLFLAEAGLLDNYRATIHWRYRESFQERFPDIEITQNIFEIDADRFTCAGGTAAMDMMIHAIARHFGRKLASEVSDLFIAGHVRDPIEEQQHMSHTRLGVTNSKVLSIIEMMENNIERPLSIAELASRAELSQRRLERLFRDNLQQSPVQFYIHMRLAHARRLLLQSDLSVIEIALASGYASHEHFSRSYKTEFGHSPMRERQLNRITTTEWIERFVDAV